MMGLPLKRMHTKRLLIRIELRVAYSFDNTCGLWLSGGGGSTLNLEAHIKCYRLQSRDAMRFLQKGRLLERSRPGPHSGVTVLL